MASNGKFSALSNKVKEHAANAQDADNLSPGRSGSAFRPTALGSSSKPGGKPTVSSKPATASGLASAAAAKRNQK